MKSDKTTELVDSVMEALLDGDHPYLEIFRKQYRVAETTIQKTPSGIFADFDVPEDTEAVPIEEDLRFGDVEVTMEGLSHGLGFVLFVENGKLSELEGYTYEEEFPETISEINVEYIGDRNVETLFSDNGSR